MMDAGDVKKLKQLEVMLRPLFFLQEKLDEKIKARYEYDDKLLQEHYQKKILGLRVEIGELLNALRFHKYWSTANPDSRDHILEEYVDGLHLMLSIGVEKGIKDYQYRGIYDMTADDLTYLFEVLMTMPYIDLTKDDYKLALEMYLKLGELLLFSWEDIKSAYAKKNIENQERQNAGY